MVTKLSAADNGGAPPPFLKLVSLNREYEGVPAVQNLSLEVAEGEYITLLGPSGCGKTTTLRMIGGFISPSGGQILLDNTDIAHLPPEKRPVNTVFQDYALFPHMTVEQNMEYGLRVRGVAKAERMKRTQAMLERVQMTAHAKRYPRYLSGGQQQRVALGRALVCSPRLLLLDEPLGALDARLREQMQIILKDLQRDLNIAFIHVTHDQDEAMALADRIVVMQAGKIEQVGTPDQIYHQPANIFVADFLGTTNLFTGTCVSCENRFVAVDVQGCLMYTNSSFTATPEEKLSLSVRPSAVHIGIAPQSTPNSFTGIVEGLVYKGEHWLVRIQLGIFHLLAMMSVHECAPLKIGDEVQVWWRAEDSWLMRA